MTTALRLLKWLLCTAAAGTICAEGITYPDLTVSPFVPGFFGVGIAPGATSSKVFGVAAQDGTFIAAVGVVEQFNGTTLQTLPVLFLPGNGITLLPTGGPNGNGAALGISADGKIKVGTAPGGTDGTAAYWDMNNQLHSLPKGGGDDATVSALAISGDGSTIAGYVLFTDQSGFPQSEAVLWTPGGTGLTRLGMPSGFDTSIATAISENGVVAGHAVKADRSVEPPIYQMRALQHEPGHPMHTLPTLGGNVDTFAYGVAELGAYTVGQSGSNAVLWSSNLGVQLFPGGGQSIAYAVRLNLSSPSRGIGRAVGARTLFGQSQKAVMWSLVPPKDEGPIKDILQFVYKKPIGSWQLTAAYALSQDGYFVGGEGINSGGQTEGWIAVLPPIFRPPRILNNAPATAVLGVPFSRSVRIDNGPAAFSAKGLPPGFQINEDNGQITGTWDDAITVKPGRYSVTVKATNFEGTGTGTFILELPPPSSIKQLIEGHSFLPFAKPPGEDTFEQSFGAGLSQNGLVAVGQDGVANDARAFRFTSAEGITGLPMLAGALRAYSIAQAVSGDGNTIVGQAASPPGADGNSRSVAVVWQNAQAGAAGKAALVRQEAVSAFGATNIGLFSGGIVSIATGVSADGSVVAGWGDASQQGVGYQIFQAFRWTSSSGLQGLGWLPGADKFSEAFGISPDGSTIVGTVADSPEFSDVTRVAFRWTQATGMVSIGRLPGGSSATARKVSANNAVIVGESSINASDTHAFRWISGGGMVDLGVLSGDTRSGANAVSADGAIVVGFSRNGFNAPRAFIWDAANGMRDLKSVLVSGNPNLANWSLRTAEGISADGKTITGDAINPNGDSEGYTAYLSRVALAGAVSRKIHGTTAFDINLPLAGDPGIECRSGGTSGDYQLIFSFANTLSSVGDASVTSGTGSVSSRMMDADSHKYIVNLTGVTNAQVITVNLTSVIDSAGNSSSSVPISVGILQGDTTGNGSVNSSDVSQTKSKSGQVVDASNFRTDVTVSGSINSSDVSAVKSKSGTGLSLSQATMARPSRP